MATKEAKDAPPPPPAGDAPPKKKGKLLIIIGAVVLLLVIAGGAAAFFLLKGGDHADDEEEVVKEEKPAKKKKKDPKHEELPVFMPLDQFTVNLRGEGNAENYLQVAISVEFEDAAEGERSKAFMPRVKNDLMLLLSSKSAADLMTKEGKEKLAAEIREGLNMILGKPEKNKKVPDGPVKDVLFTSFIIQ